MVPQRQESKQKGNWNRGKMGSKIIKQLMNFVKVLLPHQKTNVSNCREAIFQALSTCNAIRIYLVCPNGVGTDSGMQNLEEAKRLCQKNHSNSKKKKSGTTLEFMFSYLLKWPWDQAMDFSCLKRKQHFFSNDKDLVSHFWHLQQINTFSKQRAQEMLKPNPNHLAGAASPPHVGNFCSSQISRFYSVAKQWHPESKGD